MNEPRDLPAFVFSARGGGWHMQIWAQPGAKKTTLAGVLDKSLRVRLSAPPVENKANKMLVAFLAEILELKATEIILVSGEASRRKLLFIRPGQEPDWKRLNLA